MLKKRRIFVYFIGEMISVVIFAAFAIFESPTITSRAVINMYVEDFMGGLNTRAGQAKRYVRGGFHGRVEHTCRAGNSAITRRGKNSGNKLVTCWRLLLH